MMNSVKGPAEKKSPSGDTEMVRSVARAFTVLDSLQVNSPTATLVELARSTGFPVSTTQRLVNTLCHIGALRRGEDGRYRFGPGLMRIAVAALRSQQLYELVKQPLERLARATGETAYFAIANDAGEALYLRQVASSHAMHHAGWLGRAVVWLRQGAP